MPGRDAAPLTANDQGSECLDEADMKTVLISDNDLHYVALCLRKE